MYLRLIFIHTIMHARAGIHLIPKYNRREQKRILLQIIVQMRLVFRYIAYKSKI